MDQAGVSLGSAYKALGLTPSASASEVKAAYRRLALKCHPDLSPNNHGEFQRLSAAYQRIINRAPQEELQINTSHFASGGGGGGGEAEERLRSFGYRQANRSEQMPIMRTVFSRPVTVGVFATIAFAICGGGVVAFSLSRQDKRRIGVISRNTDQELVAS
ncbi:dnaJ homolog subfamily B member 6-like isoform X2 [Selaginella moellendorffii]|uniref:dnaJ homolog subfamily B member 6-like isoform X2 n=1 Tax=Selaginella moellendorffii TaxID=88036 RepID=UPI000D1CDEBE|nr:dnaJ homolog subfamily B member 6-like isoform X2 [Selaginella moellendorffii]|eukprot:XP_024531496.1 dnaJ homolog subfamily B member 6-like isoform X2 [Selaginella moellendorffii]